MLEEYARKRDFEKTPEPLDDPFAERAGPLRFVVQKHDARRLHYDFRLECDGVLKSWAVPKGPSLNPEDKRLAVQTEDHPLSYGSFEGQIPEGEYGAGEVIVWDEGVYSPDEEGKLSFEDRAEAERRIRKALEKGTLKITLRGQKLQGSWTLVRSKRKPEEWLLIKHRDAFASDKDVLEQDRSVLTGRTIEDIRAGREGEAPEAQVGRYTYGGSAQDLLDELPSTPGARRQAVPKTLAPMVPTEVPKPFSNPEWSFELKLDGVRAIAIREGDKVRLISRNEKDVTSRFPGLVQELRSIPLDEFVLDGEIVVFDADGKPSFQGLMERFQLQNERDIRQWDERASVDYCVFDLLYAGGFDLRGSPFERRRALLERLNPGSRCIRVLDAFPEEGELLFDQAAQLGFEGVVGKRLSSPYREGVRTKDWVKVKGYHTEEFLICGFTEGEGARKGTFGALVLGRPVEGKLTFCGCVGGGFSDRQLVEIRKLLEPDVAKRGPFPKPPAVKGKITWVEPKHLAEVRFMSWTRDGSLRFPIFLRLRPDLAAPEAAEMAEEAGVEPMATPAGEDESVLEALKEKKDELQITVEGHRIRFTSLDRVLWPATEGSPAVTKRDLAAYLAQVSPFILPHLRDRPLAFVRFPNGMGGESFFQKHWEKGLPEFVETVEIWSEHGQRSREWLLCNNLPTLLWLAQVSTLEVHSWYSRVTPEKGAATDSVDFSSSDEALDRSILNYPDFMVFDLDPVQKAAKGTFEPKLFRRTADVALVIKEVLDSLGLKGYLKTSGKSGLHVYVPLKRIYPYEEVRVMAETFGIHVMGLKPEDVTMEWKVERRPKKIFFDHNQNVRGKTLVNIYSPRPAPGAPVSFPLDWSDLPDVDPRDFHVFNVPGLLAKRGDRWAPILSDRQVLVASG